MDLVMPVIDGTDATRQLRALGIDVPVVMSNTAST
jgi:CheY-like chemotaxis protein